MRKILILYKKNYKKSSSRNKKIHSHNNKRKKKNLKKIIKSQVINKIIYKNEVWPLVRIELIIFKIKMPKMNAEKHKLMAVAVVCKN